MSHISGTQSSVRTQLSEQRVAIAKNDRQTVVTQPQLNSIELTTKLKTAKTDQERNVFKHVLSRMDKSLNKTHDANPRFPTSPGISTPPTKPNPKVPINGMNTPPTKASYSQPLSRMSD
jgi:hypothetical protein